MLRADLRTRLLDSSDLTDLIDERLHLVMVPEPEGPASTQTNQVHCLTYRVAAIEREEDLQGSAGHAHAMIEFFALGPDSIKVEQIVEAVRQQLQGFTGTMGTTVVDGITFAGQSGCTEEDGIFVDPENNDVPTHYTRFTCRILYQETVPTFS